MLRNGVDDEDGGGGVPKQRGCLQITVLILVWPLHDIGNTNSTIGCRIQKQRAWEESIDCPMSIANYKRGQ